MISSMATEFRSFIAEAMTSLNFGSTLAVMMSLSTNCATTGRSHWCTRSSAAMSSGRATRNRACISRSYRNGSPTPPQALPSTRERSRSGSQANRLMKTILRFKSSRAGEVSRERSSSWNRGPPRTSEKSGGSLELCMLFMIPSSQSNAANRGGTNQLLRPLFGNALLQSLGTVVNGIFHRVPFVELVALSGHFAAHQSRLFRRLFSPAFPGEKP